MPIKPVCFCLTIVLIFLFHSVSFAQQHARPKIGLTLSGGGAKGLAHIGILKAIDSAGLKIDYVTGTSMGSVIGSLYAIGYNGNEIEEIARKTDWNLLLSNQVTLRALSLEEKDEYGKYAIELPFTQGKFSLPTGALESEELWIKLSEMYYPVSKIKEFHRFKIPFACIATDITNAEAVVQDSGEIITAIRASMAIPGVFTTVENKGRRLVDGGVIRNFPVSDAVAMGANYTIGSSVSAGLLPKERLTNPIQILLQIAFLKENQDNKKQISVTDFYIHQPLSKFNLASFEKADEIIDSGITEGILLYPKFKKLADSLNRLYGQQNQQTKTGISIDSVYITDHAIRGLKTISEASFLHSVNFNEYSKYSLNDLSKMIRRAYATREYNYIHYSLEPLPDGNFEIVFDVEESAPTSAKLGIHYNSFTGISLITNLTMRNYLTPTSKSLITVNIGDNFRVRAEHVQYFGREKNLELIPTVQYESFKVNSYTDFKKDGLYRLNYFLGDLKIQLANRRVFTSGIGIKYEWEQYTPDLRSALELKGRDIYFTSYTYLHLNTLDKPIYPKKGIRLYGEFGYVFEQRPLLKYSSYGRPITSPDTTSINASNFSRLVFNLEGYRTLSEHVTLMGQLQSGINFNTGQNQFNGFLIGGLNKMYRNQIVFAGLQDATLHAQSVAAAMLGLRCKIFNNVFLIGRTNILVNDFMKNQTLTKNPRWVTGTALTVGYNSLLGPIEFSAMYSAQAKSLQTYVNIGISF
ncbi:MAG: patatin-like phospholipase family protein [Chitinophagaceae bacterium]|nr:patatin-like phospholipase family protein [Chitinophagaceae bacterium]